MTLKNRRCCIFITSFMLITPNIFARYQSIWWNISSGGVQGNIPNWIGYAIAGIILISAVTTIVIWKSYFSERVLKKSSKEDKIWDVDLLKSNTRESFIKLNKAIENKDLVILQEILTKNFFIEKKNQIDEMIKNSEKIIYKSTDIRVLEIIGCEDYKDNTYDMYIAFIEGYLLKYKVSELSGEIISNKERLSYEFSKTLHFIRDQNRWKLNFIDEKVNILDIYKTKNFKEK